MVVVGGGSGGLACSKEGLHFVQFDISALQSTVASFQVRMFYGSILMPENVGVEGIFLSVGFGDKSSFPL